MSACPLKEAVLLLAAALRAGSDDRGEAAWVRWRAARRRLTRAEYEKVMRCFFGPYHPFAPAPPTAAQ